MGEESLCVGPASKHCPCIKHVKSKNAKRSNVAMTMSKRLGQKDVGSQDQGKADDAEVFGSTGRRGDLKVTNKIKTSSLGILGLLGVSPNVEGTFSKETS